MRFRISPKKENTSAIRYVYRKDNQEIKFGVVFSNFEFISANHQKWIESYSSQQGVCLSDVDFKDKNFDLIKFEPLIFFSETISDKDKQKLIKLFNKNCEYWFGNFEDALIDLHWERIQKESFFWGELNCEEYFES